MAYMVDVALRRAADTVLPPGRDLPATVDLGGRPAPPLPVHDALRPLLPGGLRRGSTVGVSGSLSLLFALLGAASADGAWCALVGFPRVSAEAVREYGVDLARLAIVSSPGPAWTTAVGALLDSVDVVAARPPPRLAPGDVRRLAARARTRDAVLVPYTNGPNTKRDGSGEWPGADVRLRVTRGAWSGIGVGTGRLRARRVEVQAEGRGAWARPQSVELWLPAADGGVRAAAPVQHPLDQPIAEVIGLAG